MEKLVITWAHVWNYNRWVHFLKETYCKCLQNKNLLEKCTFCLTFMQAQVPVDHIYFNNKTWNDRADSVQAREQLGLKIPSDRAMPREPISVSTSERPQVRFSTQSPPSVWWWHFWFSSILLINAFSIWSLMPLFCYLLDNQSDPSIWHLSGNTLF